MFEEKQESSIELKTTDEQPPDKQTSGAQLASESAEVSLPVARYASDGPSTFKVKVPNRTESKIIAEVPTRRRVSERILKLVIFYQVLPWGFLWVVTPGYIAPFTRSGSVQLTLLALAVWQALGIFMCLRRWEESEYPSAMQWFILITVFMVPLCLAPWVGPLIFNVFNAVGR